MKIEDIIEKLKCCENPEQREWLYAGHADSYNTEVNRAGLYILEGSPPRGFIIYTNDFAVRLDDRGKTIACIDIATFY